MLIAGVVSPKVAVTVNPQVPARFAADVELAIAHSLVPSLVTPLAEVVVVAAKPVVVPVRVTSVAALAAADAESVTVIPTVSPSYQVPEATVPVALTLFFVVPAVTALYTTSRLTVGAKSAEGAAE